MSDEVHDADAQPLQRKLSTILSADVAQFSRLMGEDEEGTLRTFRGHKQVFESLVAMHSGRIFNTAGDAILAEFGSAVEAVRCATDIQSALRTRNDQLEPSRQVRFRIGVNLGDVMVQGEDLMGDGVNVAARLQTAAEPGGICISGSVHDQIRDKLSLSFQSLGEKNFKNIQQPVRTFSIAETEGGGVLPTPKPAAPASGGAAKWIAAVAALVAVAGGGYWAMRGGGPGKAEPLHAVAPAAPPAQPAAAAAKPTTPPAATPAVATAVKTTAAAAAPAVHVDDPTKTPARDTTPRAPEPRRAAAAAGPHDGSYVGPLCYAGTPMRPERCYRTEATIAGGRITGQWDVPHEPGVTMIVKGDVAESGDVTMEMHGQRRDGAPAAVIDLSGTFHGRMLGASGKFRNGRPVTLTWREKPAAPR